jgi:hypothetical protein
VQPQAFASLDEEQIRMVGPVPALGEQDEHGRLPPTACGRLDQRVDLHGAGRVGELT